MFSCEFCELFKNIFFQRTPPVAPLQFYTFLIHTIHIRDQFPVNIFDLDVLLLKATVIIYLSNIAKQMDKPYSSRQNSQFRMYQRKQDFASFNLLDFLTLNYLLLTYQCVLVPLKKPSINQSELLLKSVSQLVCLTVLIYIV